MQRFRDIHTHIPGTPDALLSIPVADVEQVIMSNIHHEAAQYYSLQLHPWHLTSRQDIVLYINKANELQSDPYFVAIGECGLDALCSTPFGLQVEAFRAALQIADELGKPVIIHCVKRWSEVMAEARGHQGPLIIHGFRKGPALARQLLDAGFSLSLGKHYPAELLEIIPPDRLFFESDETNTNKISLSQ